MQETRKKLASCDDKPSQPANAVGPPQGSLLRTKEVQVLDVKYNCTKQCPIVGQSVSILILSHLAACYPMSRYIYRDL
jgi:hypothetical protein